LLATGGAWPFRGVRLWDLNQGTLRATLVGHDESEVKDVAFSPDGHKLVSVGGRSDHPSGGQVYLWNLDRMFR
jgi:WD40 repeat protein